MIVTVTPNPALDLTYLVPAIELGETHRVPTAEARAGGKSLNVARVLHQQGHQALAISVAGGLTGKEFARELAASGVPHRIVAVQAATRRTIALVDEKHAQTSIFNEFGEDHSPAEWQRLTNATQAALEQARCLVGSGSLPLGADPDFYPELVRAATSLEIASVIDTSGPALLAAAEAGATVLKPNRHELVEATGDADPVRAARSLLQRGASLVLVSLGEDGMIAVSREDPKHPLRARLGRVLDGNPTGAGDAAVAAIAACLADGITDPEQILRLATAWSAAAVLMPLAGEISPLHAQLADELTIDTTDRITE
ncbi:1-phosphofructokinase family hexose kinase [Leifsonia sp. A12D58]|uniref:1-phosphofructokinase family hexose kinase n=1 Tax=Leifsonia sp. A12D58 TaxID=3397674 RepID=UPI0039DF3D41